jgi:hypothetical protein
MQPRNSNDVFQVCLFSHRSVMAYGAHVETRPPETVGSADRAGAIGGLAPALVASGVGFVFRVPLGEQG